MKRRFFCKSAASILLSWGVTYSIAFSNTNNKVLSGQLFVNNKLTEGSFENLNNALIETKNSKAVVKVNNDVFLIQANSNLKFFSNKINEVIKGSFHGIFGKREKELLIKIPKGTIGIRGTAVYLDLDSQNQKSSLCNCFGHTVIYSENGQLLKSLKNSKSEMHSAVIISNEGVQKTNKFKHDVVEKKFLNI